MTAIQRTRYSFKHHSTHTLYCSTHRTECNHRWWTEQSGWMEAEDWATKLGMKLYFDSYYNDFRKMK